MVEGAGSDDYRPGQTMLIRRPDLMHRILAVTADAVAAVPERADRGRRAGGDDLRQLGGCRRRRVPGVQPRLHLGAFEQLKRARGRAHPEDRVHQGRRGWLADIAAARPDVIGLDWTMNLGRRAARVGRAAGQPRSERAVRQRRAGGRRGDTGTVPTPTAPGPSGHIFNLGHGISQHTPPENVRWWRRCMRIRGACDTRIAGASGAICQPCFPDCPQAWGLALKCAKSGRWGLTYPHRTGSGRN